MQDNVLIDGVPVGCGGEATPLAGPSTGEAGAGAAEAMPCQPEAAIVAAQDFRDKGREQTK